MGEDGIPQGKFFKSSVSKMGRKKIINVPKSEFGIFKEGKKVIVILGNNNKS